MNLEKLGLKKDFFAESSESGFLQPAFSRINLIAQKSSYERNPDLSAKCVLKGPENSIFKIDIYEDGKDVGLSDVQNLFNNIFLAGEIESELVLRNAIESKTPWGTPDVKYRVVHVRNEKNELVAVCAGATLPLEKGDDLNREMIYCVEYIATDDKARGTGIGREAYLSGLLDSLQIAKANKATLSMVVGECTESSEKFWDGLGWKRIYTQESDYMFSEVPYIQPALKFNPDTGEVADDASDVPEHFTVDFFGLDPDPEKIKMAYVEFIDYTSMWPREAFTNNEAYEKHLLYIDGLKKNFLTKIDKSKNMLCASIQEKAELAPQGYFFNDFKYNK